jgi:pyruvate kinase
MLLAKMEKPEAIKNFDDILQFVDGTMVARGDLGVEMPLEELPGIQKKISSATRRAAKPVITATQMLRSMIDNPRPTRAEVTDTANAILDGASAVMLSEETAVGSYPVEAVEVLDKIARATEPTIESHRMLVEPDAAVLPPVESAITRTACVLAEQLNAACIVVVTYSGDSARQVARYRQQIPIIAFTSKEDTVNKMPLSWGIIPVLEQILDKPTELSDLAIEYAVNNGIATSGDRIIFTCGYPVMAKGSTNTIQVLTVP